MSKNSFNALYRAHSISTIKALEMDVIGYLFQCPISGPLHFYTMTKVGKTITFRCFNALYRAHSISTGTIGL